MNEFTGMKFHNAVLADLPKYVSDPNYWLEQKADGIRAQLRIADGELLLLAYRGELLRSSTALKALPGISQHCLELVETSKQRRKPIFHLDGEIIGSTTFWAFDLLDYGSNLRHQPFELRRDRLEEFFKILTHTVDGGFGKSSSSATGPERLKLLPCARTTKQKQRLVETLLEQHAEGVMIKHRAAPYDVGRRVYHSLKLKFTKTVDCIILQRNRDRDCNAVLGVYDGKRVVEIGCCSMIGKPDAQVGDVVEVEYLYAMKRLVQPTLLRLRPDKRACPRDCSIDQLSFTKKEIITLNGKR